MRTLKLGWVFQQEFKNCVYNNNKGRLVAWCNQQRPGIDYGEWFSPVIHWNLSALADLDIIQFDIAPAYLHGTPKVEVYMEQSGGMSLPERRIGCDALGMAFMGQDKPEERGMRS